MYQTSIIETFGILVKVSRSLTGRATQLRFQIRGLRRPQAKCFIVSLKTRPYSLAALFVPSILDADIGVNNLRGVMPSSHPVRIQGRLQDVQGKTGDQQKYFLGNSIA